MQSNTITIFHKLLKPSRRKLHHLQIKKRFISAINKTALLLPVTALIWCLILIILSLFETLADKVTLWGLVITIFITASWPTIILIYTLFRLPDWIIVTKHIDAATNTHNIVSIAYEHSFSDSPSLFAKIAVYRGIQTIETFTGQIATQKVNGIMIRRIATGFTIAVILYAASFWIAKSEIQNGENKILALIKPELKSGQSNNVSDKTLQPPRRHKETANNIIEKLSFSQTAQTTIQKSLLLSDVSERKSYGNDNTGQQTGKSSLTQSGSAASAQNTNKQNKTSDTPQSLRKDNKSGILSAEKKTQENSSNTASKGMAGSSPNAESDIKASLVSGGLGETPDNDEADQNQQERPQNSPASLGLRPELADKQAAPNRNLGMTGKPGDKAGDGRGGPGLVKKSRATASALSAMTIPVYIKGQIQPGKSKSYSQSLPLTADQSSQSAFNANNSNAKEGQMILYTPDARWKSIIEAYFTNLRNSESK